MAKWKDIAKAVAYELRPFSIPSGMEFREYFKVVKMNLAVLMRAAYSALKVVFNFMISFHVVTYTKLFVWLLFWWVFSKFDFGVIFFIMSCISAMFLNLGSEKRKGELSAYSVFNKGCRSLIGTLRAEQFESEIMHRNVNAPLEDDDAHDVDDMDEYVFVEGVNQRNEGGQRRRKKKSRQEILARRQRNVRNDLNEYSSGDE
mmetsp:Transcript_15787/g.23491  ORF Transcript_15787/g.23491 Transcript_15787/m.23491 type:complete len:202 (+) Transcript_15787:86-691(+)